MFDHLKNARRATGRGIRAAGLMSGTSADGVSAAIIDIDGRGRVKLLAARTYPWPEDLRRRIFRLFDPKTARLDEICRLNFIIGEMFAEAVIGLAKSARIPLKSIDLIGSHGQTICHLPRGQMFHGRRVGSTLQIGEPCVIAERTGITTVADFRPRDMAAGGEGAPLVPFADMVMFGDAKKSRAVQNIGGIANVTWLPAGCGAEDVVAFDTGPGNMVIDRLAQRATKGRVSYDEDGRMAARGSVDEKLLAELMRHPFLRRRPPRSTGREEFGAQFADKLWRRVGRRKISANDLIATATAFTARSIADAYGRFLPGGVDEVILCGGGAHNRTLVKMLKAETVMRVMRSEEIGVDGDAREAMSFAILAWAAEKGVAGNVPGATGAERGAVLGKIAPGRQ
jgi:anhydro-N-acetylmuramic acid kinase